MELGDDTMKRVFAVIFFLFLVSQGIVFAQDADEADKPDVSVKDNVEVAAVDYMLGGVFEAITIDGKTYQQIGLRPELTLWKVGIGLDISLLLDEEGKVREEDWDETDDYIDKIYYIRFGKKGDPLYFRFGGLDYTTLGYGSIISGYTNMLEYPTYKRQGLDFGIETTHFGMQAIVNDFKELKGRNRAVMGGSRVYVKPFSRLQIGGSFAGDLNEYKGLRDSDDDGYPDEVDFYPNNDNYVTEREYYAAVLGEDEELGSTIVALVNAGLISSIMKSQLTPYSDNRSKTGFWAADAGLDLIKSSFLNITIYSQYVKSINTGGWGFTAPGLSISIGNIIEIYGDYRQQSEKFIFGYYNNTYDLERAKYVDDGTGDLYVVTKKESLESAEKLKGYFGGAKINFFNLFNGKIEYQDMRWGEADIEDKSIRGELELRKYLIPMIAQAKAYYVQNNVDELQWKTESTVMGAVVGIGIGEGVSVNFNYLITSEDKNGDGEIKGDEEQITNVSVSTTAVF